MMDELKKALQELGVAFEDFKKINDARLAEIQQRGDATSETLVKLEAAEVHMEDLQKRVGEIEADATARTFETNLDNTQSDEDRAHMSAYKTWLRKPNNARAQMEFEEASKAAAASNPQMAVTITTTGGGNAIPTEVAARLEQKIYDLSPIRQIANVQGASNENLRFVVIDNNATGGWVAAGTSRSETVTPLFQAVTPTYGTAYAYPQVYEEAMNDINFDVASFIEGVAAEVLASQEGTAFVTGNGTARPTGFMNGNAVSPVTIVSTGDEASPQRAFGSVQYFATGAAADFQNDMLGSPLNTGDPAAVLFNTVYGLKAQYRSNARWVMNKTVLGKIRKFRDGNGNYLYLPGLVAGQPSSLLGYPITEAEDVANVAANAVVAAFGDFNRAYQICDIISTLRITVDDNITAPGWVKFYIRRRVGGILLNDDALKVVKCATS